MRWLPGSGPALRAALEAALDPPRSRGQPLTLPEGTIRRRSSNLGLMWAAEAASVCDPSAVPKSSIALVI